MSVHICIQRGQESSEHVSSGVESSARIVFGPAEKTLALQVDWQHYVNSFENKKGTFEKPFGSSWSFEILRFFRGTIKEFVSWNSDGSVTETMMFLLKKCLQRHTKQQTIKTEQKTDAWWKKHYNRALKLPNQGNNEGFSLTTVTPCSVFPPVLDGQSDDKDHIKVLMW